MELLPGFIEELESALESGRSSVQRLASSGSTPREPPLIDATGPFLDRSRRQFLRGRGVPGSGQYDPPEEVFGADGAAPLYRRLMLGDVKVDGEYSDDAFVD